MTTFMAWLGGIFAVVCVVGGGIIFLLDQINWDH